MMVWGYIWWKYGLEWVVVFLGAVGFGGGNYTGASVVSGVVESV